LTIRISSRRILHRSDPRRRVSVKSSAEPKISITTPAERTSRPPDRPSKPFFVPDNRGRPPVRWRHVAHDSPRRRLRLSDVGVRRDL